MFAVYIIIYRIEFNYLIKISIELDPIVLLIITRLERITIAKNLNSSERQRKNSIIVYLIFMEILLRICNTFVNLFEPRQIRRRDKLVAGVLGG